MEKQFRKSYGIIPIYKGGDEPMVVIVKNSKGKHWGFPKGTPEGDETPMETAIRELQEETGIVNIKVSEDVSFQESYEFPEEGYIKAKTNTYYLGEVTEMTLGKDLDEVDDAKWVSFDEAKNLLTFDRTKEVVGEIGEYIK